MELSKYKKKIIYESRGDFDIIDIFIEDLVGCKLR